MTTATSTRKPRLTAAEKRELEAVRLRDEQERAERKAAYEAESAQLLADNAAFIAEQTEVFVKTGAAMINHIVDNYKPRHKWFRLEFKCSGYDFGIQMEDRIENSVMLYGSYDSGFKINHSMTGNLPVEKIMEFANHLIEVSNISLKIQEIGASLFAEYEKSSYRRREADRPEGAIDTRVLSAIATAAAPRINDYLRLRLGH